MKLPQFWRDTGSWNDPVVSAGVPVGLGAWVGLALWLGRPWLLQAALFLGPVTGFLLGVGASITRPPGFSLLSFEHEPADRTPDT